ncbi:MAG: hypothetical protein IH940_10895 [Acidobacteria bacterium]|nr:hypothetical protein [Acidobacteriota bacterium]
MSEPIILGDETPESLWQMLDSQGWGDGLPIVAPTAARVDAALRLDSGDPDEVIAVLEPRAGLATRREIAINAVMAGCPPEVLPVVIAAVRALGSAEINLRGVNATTHPVAPLLIVHGPAASELGFNSGLGAFGPGNRANATVGRAVRFVLLHVAGAVPGPGDVSTQGQPSKYTYCVAENVSESPWPAYHRTMGLGVESAVTVHCGENPHNFHDMESNEPTGILDKAATVMATLGTNNAPISQGEFFIGLCPEHASTIAARGWTRDDVSSYLFQRARRSLSEVRAAFDLLAWDEWMMALREDDLVPVTGSAKNIKVFVVGGPGKHSCVIPSWGMTKSVTVAIEGSSTEETRS